MSGPLAAHGFASAAYHAKLGVIALLIAPLLLLTPMSVGHGVQRAAASGCSVSTWLVGNPIGPGFRAYASWGPSCSTSYHNTLAIYEQIGYNDWYDVYGETEPPLQHASNVSIPTFASLVGCGTHGLGYYKSVAYIGGITVWSSGKYCP
jgi:hypothetical protein